MADYYSVFQQSLKLTTNTLITHTVFKLISNPFSGGALLFNKSGSSFVCSHSLFIETSSEDRGGAICIAHCDSVHILKSCFSNCKALYSPSFVIWSDYYKIKEGVVNYTTETINIQPYHSSGFGGREKSMNSYNNNSNFEIKIPISTYRFSCWILLTISSDIHFQLSQLYNCTSTSFLMFYGSKDAEISKVNIINSQSSEYLFAYNSDSHQPETLIFKEIYFIDCEIKEIQNFESNIATYYQCYCNTEVESPLIYSKDIEKHALELEYCDILSRVSCVYKQISNIHHGKIFTTILLGINK